MLSLFSSCIQENNCKELIKEQKEDVKIDTLPYFTETIDPYISVYEEVLPADLCDKIIKLYAKNNHLHFKGHTSSGLVTDVKKTTDMSITRADVPELNKIDEILKNNLGHYMEKYIIKISNTCDNIYLFRGEMQDTGYHMQKYNKNEGLYITHTDDSSQILSNEIQSRVVTFIWYLNDVTEGGETIFINKCKIKPKKGNLLIFPSLWTYPHCGMVPESHDKYIITGWMYMSMNNIQN